MHSDDDIPTSSSIHYDDDANMPFWVPQGGLIYIELGFLDIGNVLEELVSEDSKVINLTTSDFLVEIGKSISIVAKSYHLG